MYRFFNLFLLRCASILRHPVWGHIRVHIFTRPISYEPTKLSSITTKYLPLESCCLQWKTCQKWRVKKLLLWYVDSSLHQFKLDCQLFLSPYSPKFKMDFYRNLKKIKFLRTRNVNAILFCIKYNCNMKIQFCTMKCV